MIGRATCSILALLFCLAAPTQAKERVRKSPFSSSTYRIWKEPRRGPTPRSVDQVIKRSPPVGNASQGLEDKGGRFVADPGQVRPPGQRTQK